MFHKIIKMVRADHNLRDVIKGGFFTLLLRIVGFGAAFVFNIVIARVLGPENTGLYFMAFSVIAIAAVLSRLGLDNIMLRFIAKEFTSGNRDQVQSVYSNGMSVALLSSVILASTIYLCSELISMYIFREALLNPVLKIMSLGIVPFCLLFLQSESLKGTRKISAAAITNGALLPICSLSLSLFLLLYASLSSITINVRYFAVIFCISSTCSLLFGTITWGKNYSFKSRGSGLSSISLVSLGFPLFIVAVMNLVIQWSDTIILGIFLSGREVGIYNIALRISSLTIIALVAVNSVVAPKFASLFADKDFASLEKLAKQSACFVSLLAAPFLLLLLVWPELVLQMFGERFLEGSRIVSILAFGQFVNVVTGSVGYLLMMTGNNKSLMFNVVCTAALNLLLNITFVPKFGMVGAACTSCFCMVFRSVLSTFFVYKKIGIMPFPFLKMDSIIEQKNEAGS